MGRLDGKSAVVTGGGIGIGRAASQRFALEGVRVVIAELNIELGEQTEQLIRDAGGEATFVQTDITEAEQAAGDPSSTCRLWRRSAVSICTFTQQPRVVSSR
jgi:NAD(P)-dependent dehydrogenase (short-subunit alcohol dehydrogenase family)